MIENIKAWIRNHFFTKVELVDGGALDSRYFRETEHLNVSAGAGDAGKPIKLDAGGHVDATMINDADVDHGTTGGLADDDHTQYALLAGRAGGQTLKGGTASGEDLTLMSTNHATKGNLFFGSSTYDEANNRLGIGTTAPDYRLHLSGDNSTTFALIKLQNTQASGHNWWLYAGAAGVAANFGIYDETAAGYRLTIDPSGYVQFSALGEAWTAATYTSGWVDFSASYFSVGYKKVGDLIYVRGMAKRTSGSSATIFTLPSGYRPAKQARFASSSNDAHCDIDIDTSGNVVLVGGSPTIWVTLDGIKFSTL